jgi:hypothetical protein
MPRHIHASSYSHYFQSTHSQPRMKTEAGRKLGAHSCLEVYVHASARHTRKTACTTTTSTSNCRNAIPSIAPALLHSVTVCLCCAMLRYAIPCFRGWRACASCWLGVCWLGGFARAQWGAVGFGLGCIGCEGVRICAES